MAGHRPAHEALILSRGAVPASVAAAPQGWCPAVPVSVAPRTNDVHPHPIL